MSCQFSGVYITLLRVAKKMMLDSVDDTTINLILVSDRPSSHTQALTRKHGATEASQEQNDQISWGGLFSKDLLSSFHVLWKDWAKCQQYIVWLIRSKGRIQVQSKLEQRN